MNNDRILLSETLDRIDNAISDIRTIVNMDNASIEDVADAVEELAGTYKVASIEEMGQLEGCKEGDLCIVTNENYSYIPYSPNILTRKLIFPKSFTAELEEEFSDVNFAVYSNGSALTSGGHVVLTRGGSSSGSGSGSGGSGTLCLTFSLAFGSISPDSPCSPFAIEVIYDFDEEQNLWTCNTVHPVVMNGISFYEKDDSITIIFPIDCGFTREGGADLPSIISTCVKLYNHQTNATLLNMPTSLQKAYTYNGFFLPYEITLDSRPSEAAFWRNVDYNEQELATSWFQDIHGQDYLYLYNSAENNNLKINIEYKRVNNLHVKLYKVSVQDDRGYIYNYNDFDTTYPNRDLYLYLPYEYYLHTAPAGEWGKMFQQIISQKSQVYKYISGCWTKQN